eukprot:TRINITY_DN1115_c0_g1_i1.p1 TRINITY_DN1115_c0_g1~~TRINITY_DN1115_c0_g1_i1.p1  ORF type:complete len:260 (-),score=64.18 TRINITY_DN1115_c0_g1_i1:134-829(-)
MDDEDVRHKLHQMVSFIKKEAEEKASEIRVKAQEEFSIEKQKLSQAEKMKIMKDYERKEKQVEVQKKISYSNQINQARLKALKSREDAVTSIFTDAKNSLDFISVPGEKYEQLLKNLIVQGLIKLEENEVRVQSREVDAHMVRKVLPEAASIYKQITGRSVNLSLDTKFLAPPRNAGLVDSCSGGVVLLAHEGKIICDNTLDQRLKLVQEQRLPEVRMTLFGRSASRVFDS